MKSKEYLSIKKMIEYIEKVERYTKNCDFEDFKINEEKVDATVFSLSQIGELVKNISNGTIDKYRNIEWIVIKNLRNKIVHDYEGINLEFIWDIIKSDIKSLKIELNKIIENEKVEK